MYRTLVALVDNHLATVERVIGMLRRRMYKIESLTITTTADPSLARLTIQVDDSVTHTSLVERNLHRLCDVIWTQDVTDTPGVSRELALVKLVTSHAALMMTQRYRAEVVYRENTKMIVEMKGSVAEVDEFLQAIRPFGVIEVTRTGRVTLTHEDISCSKPVFELENRYLSV